MPIVVKDYTWTEDDKTIFITVPLKGVRPHKVDLFSTEEYLKVSYPPYIFECFLYAPVHDTKGAAQIGNGAVLFKLEKQEPAMWERLHHVNIEDKLWQRNKRDAAVKRYQERHEEEQKKKAETKRELSKYGVDRQIKLEDKSRKDIEDEKESERKKATEELEQWKEHQNQLSIMEKEKEKERKEKEEKERAAELKARLLGESKASKANGMFHENGKEEEEAPLPVRQKGSIEIQHTHRDFPTPLRESVKPEEDEWLRKQAEMRRIVEIDDKDLSEQERNPMWLKEKGDNFFKSGDLHSAINAYTHAIRLNTNMPSIYSNRAACHLKLGNHMKCIEDSSKALDYLTPPVPANAASRCKAHIRRGTSLVHMELYVEGLMDYDAAIKLDPNNEELKADADRLRVIIQSSSGTAEDLD